MKQLILCGVGFFFTTIILAQNLDSVFQDVKYRNIGPFRGGRAVAVSGVKDKPLTYFMGTTGGGLWKTDDAGIKWKNISDGYFKTGSVGAVAVSESHPNVVYCGMGEHAPRGVMTSYGDGMYKSTNSGKTWKKIGLEKTQHISRICIHPNNPEILFVAAQGALYGPNQERGIYKSINGGATWTQVFFINSSTGCSELSMDMNNPDVLYAGMWEHRRLPWKIISGGEGSGIYKSEDGGETWLKIHVGLPKEMGKTAVSVCRSNSDRVYALIESDWEEEKGGLFVSENAGKKWSKVSSDHRLIQRAWYYTEVFTDPDDQNTLFVLSAPALRSIDGGNSWETISASHGDYHDLWINPDDSKNIAIANDGGAEISFNDGESWSGVDHMATGQIYRLNVDNLYPYSIYSGQQDNSSFSLKNLNLDGYGITGKELEESAGGESAFLAFNPDEPRYVMGGSYQGTIELLDLQSNTSVSIMEAPIQYLGRDAKDMRYRFNWNAPIIASIHEENTFYHGAQVLLKTSDLGASWSEVSPDLTKNDKNKQGQPGGPYTNEAVGAETYGTISYVLESPYEAGVIWVATDDGLLQLTKDNGQSWQNMTPKGMQECLINAIEISPHNPAIIYIATTRYKFNDYNPGLYKSSDYGKTWKSINAGIPYGAFTRVIREDPSRENMLFAGTETGMYISWNGGLNWQPFQLNLPIVPITDIKITHGDMQVATSGRAIWILDDMGLLNEFEENKEINRLQLFTPEASILGHWGSQLNKTSEEFKGSANEGVNPANGSVIYYQLPRLGDSIHITIEIKDQNGKLINKFSSEKNEDFNSYPGGPSKPIVLSKKEGINRFVWNHRYEDMLGVPEVYLEASFRGHKVGPGMYIVHLIVEEEHLSVKMEVATNPLDDITEIQFNDYHLFMQKMENTLNVMHGKVNLIYQLRKQLEKVQNGLKKDEKFGEIKKVGDELVSKMKNWDINMVQRKSKAYDDVENFPNKFTAEFIFLINQSENNLARINASSKERLNELLKEWAILEAEAKEIIETDIPSYNKLLWDKGIGAIQEFK